MKSRILEATAAAIICLLFTPLSHGVASIKNYRDAGGDHKCNIAYDYSTDPSLSFGLSASDENDVADALKDQSMTSAGFFDQLEKAKDGRVTIPAAQLDAFNKLVGEALGLVDRRLKLRIHSATVTCPQAAVSELRAKSAERQRQIQRAVAYAFDSDPVLRERGVSKLNELASRTDLVRLSPQQRETIASAAYASTLQELRVMRTSESMTLHFAGVTVLDRLHDPRAANLYVEYVKAREEGIFCDSKLKRVRRIQPPPRQVVQDLRKFVTDHEYYQGFDSDCMKSLIYTIAVLGQRDELPFLNQLTRSHNAEVADWADKAIESIKTSPDVFPRPTPSRPAEAQEISAPLPTTSSPALPYQLPPLETSQTGPVSAPAPAKDPDDSWDDYGFDRCKAQAQLNNVGTSTAAEAFLADCEAEHRRERAAKRAKGN